MHNTTRAASAAFDPLCTTARTRRLFPCALPHTPLPPPAVASQHARSTFFLFRVPTLFSAGRPPFLLAASYCAASAYQRPQTSTHAPAAHCATLARAHARTRAHGRPTADGERRDVRSAGVADWKTARGGNTERTLTAAAPPSPCGPYRHALARWPPRKARPFCFLNYSNKRPSRGGLWANC